MERAIGKVKTAIGPPSERTSGAQCCKFGHAARNCIVGRDKGHKRYGQQGHLAKAPRTKGMSQAPTGEGAGVPKRT